MFSTLGSVAILSWPFAAALAVVLLCHDILQSKWDFGLIRRLSIALVGAVSVVLGFLVCISLAILNNRSSWLLWIRLHIGVSRSCL